jgi:hypothetical protein
LWQSVTRLRPGWGPFGFVMELRRRCEPLSDTPKFRVKKVSASAGNLMRTI